VTEMNIDPSEKTLIEMKASYGTFVEQSVFLELDPAVVPDELVAYIPFAALWGLSDDLEREQRVAEAPEEAKADLVRIVQLIDDQLDEWLAGDEANSPKPSMEYIAFSAMRMAADYM